jgi:hypothetical protein
MNLIRKCEGAKLPSSWHPGIPLPRFVKAKPADLSEYATCPLGMDCPKCRAGFLMIRETGLHSRIKVWRRKYNS